MTSQVGLVGSETLASLSLRLKHLLGPATGVKAKKKKVSVTGLTSSAIPDIFPLQS
jgi:hypothetical protein